MKITRKLIAFAAITAMAFFTVSCGEEEHEHSGGDDHSQSAEAEEGSGKKMDAPIDPAKNCIVSGDDLGSDAVSLVHEGTTLKFCCEDCIPEFKKNPAKYLARIK